jgi:hypothetical protein
VPKQKQTAVEDVAWMVKTALLAAAANQTAT